MISSELMSGCQVETIWPGAVGGANVSLERGGSLPRLVVSANGGLLNCVDATGATRALTLPAGCAIPCQLASLLFAGSAAHTLTFVW